MCVYIVDTQSWKGQRFSSAWVWTCLKFFWFSEISRFSVFHRYWVEVWIGHGFCTGRNSRGLMFAWMRVYEWMCVSQSLFARSFFSSLALSLSLSLSLFPFLSLSRTHTHALPHTLSLSLHRSQPTAQRRRQEHSISDQNLHTSELPKPHAQQHPWENSRRNQEKCLPSVHN